MKKLLVFFIFFIIMTTSVFSQFDYIETEDLRLVYIGGIHSFLAPYTARCFQNSLSFHKQLWDYEPSGKVTIILHDLGDFGNAGASTIPNNRVSFSIAPLNFVYETAPANERINSTMNHELVHIVAGDQACNTDRFFRSIFNGKIAATSEHPETIIYSHLTSPRRAAPIWYHEGIAVFLETWMAGGLGRALGAYDEMVFRTMVYDSSRIYDNLGLESEGIRTGFMAGVNSYLYGTRFYSYLALMHGPQKVMEWVARTDGTSKYYTSQFKKTFGESLEDSWSDWIEWEKEFQKRNIDSINVYPVTPYREISKKALGSVSRTYYNPDGNKLYAGIYYPGQSAHLAEIDIESSSIEKLTNVKGAALFFVTSLAYDPFSNTLFYTTDNNSWRDIVSLDINSGKTTRLQKDTRIGDLVFDHSDNSLWGIRHFNGISTLVKIVAPYDDWDQVYSFPYGRDIYDLDVSRDGKKISASLAEISGRQTLIMMDAEKMISGDSTYTTLFDFQNSIPGNFTFSDDGNYLYGSSYYSGVSNIYRYDIAADSMEAITNGITGFFRPVPISKDSLAAFRYTSDGFTPVMIPNLIIEDISPIVYLGQEVVEKHPIVKDWIVASPSVVDLDTLISDSGHYSGLKNLSLATMYPVVEGYQHYTAVGFRFNFSEPIGFHRADLTTSYTPSEYLSKDERWHVEFNYKYLDWTLNFRYNDADFYDLFGPTKTSRKGFALGLRFGKSLLYDPPKHMNYSIKLTRYWDLERLPDFQNISTSYDKFWTLNAQLGYRNRVASIGAVDYESGISWQLQSKNSLVNKHYFPQIISNLDYGFRLPVKHSSFWIRTSMGYCDGGRMEPFANFFFGGFGNNWVDYQYEKRYRQYISFPGTELNAIAGTNYFKTSLEVSLPPLRFRKLGMSSFYLSWIHPVIFTSGIITNIDDKTTQMKLASIGMQLDFKMTMMSYLRMTFSAGYARAFEKHYETTDEWMFSLKIL